MQKCGDDPWNAFIAWICRSETIITGAQKQVLIDEGWCAETFGHAYLLTQINFWDKKVPLLRNKQCLTHQHLLMYSSTFKHSRRPESHIKMPQWAWQTSSASPQKTTGGVTEEPSPRTGRHPRDMWIIRSINITKYTKTFTSGALGLQINHLHHIWKDAVTKLDNLNKNLHFLHMPPPCICIFCYWNWSMAAYIIRPL